MVTWRDAAGELLLGSTCPGCARPGWGLCGECSRVLAGRPGLRGQLYGLPVIAAWPFEGVARAALTAYKERGAWSLARPLGEALAWSVAGLLDRHESVTVVPVPSSPARVRERGQDVTWLIARRAAWALRRVGVPADARRGLRHGRSVADQAGLGVADRGRNLAGSMRGRPVPGACVVVDDIVTSGATLAEAIRAAREAGNDVRGAAVVAATPRRRGGSGATDWRAA